MRIRKIVMRSLLIAGVICTLGLGLLPTRARGLPPRPTPETAGAPAGPVAGGTIELQIQFPADWPWGSAHWQTLWTIVQWQDAHGDWHDVEGWQGTLEEVRVDGDGAVTGYKRWWVAQDDLGTGPFRWVVYQGADGPQLVASEPFDLPGRTGGWVMVTAVW